MLNKISAVSHRLTVAIALLSIAFVGGCAKSDLPDPMSNVLSGYAMLTGTVTGSEDGVLPVIFANNTAKDVAYTVFVVDGKYRAVNLIPGPYEITIRAAVDQLEGFTSQTVNLDIAADSNTTLDFAIEGVGLVDNYIGGVPYPDPEIVPYDELYPPGPGRDIMERTCHGCHAVNFYSFNFPRAYSGGRADKDKAAWGVTVDRMHKGPAFRRPGKAPIFDPELLPPEDRDILVDYLAEHFGAGSAARVAKLEEEPELDEAALAKAMFVEYNYHEPEGKYEVWGWPHQVDFDPEGNVWLAYTACCIVKFDPRTGDQTVFEDHGGGHGIVVDPTDGTVWYSGDVVRRLDPKTGLVDHWKIGEDRYLGSNTQIFDSKGNLWLSLLAAGGVAKWDRETDSITWWEVPVVRSRPYGIIVDYKDKVWFADYHNGGLTRFDPETEEFKHFPLVKDRTTSAIRRLGVDSKGIIWASTWGNRAFKDASLFRLDPETGETTKRHLGLPYGAGYNAEADSEDNIWVAPDNYLTKYDQVADAFTHYPLPVRSDSLKTTITRDDAVWFIYRNAGKYAGYGGVAAVLYPDMDKIPTLAAYHSEDSAGNHLAGFEGPPAPPVLGKDRIEANETAKNAEEYRVWATEAGLFDEE
jgi:streptogramin lyase/mono/diheme cytochrome c family protein